MAERSLAELEDALTQGAARMDAAMCSWLETLAEFDARAAYERWECRSAAHFLNWRCGISLHTARQHVRVARRLMEFPLVRASFADGVLSYSKVRAVLKIATAETEATLVEWSQCATAAQIDKVAAQRRSVEAREHDNRFVQWRHDDNGAFVLRARLSAEEGELLLAALRAARDSIDVGEDVPGETLLGRPTMADALVAVAETTLAHGPTPVAGGDRHTVLAHVDVATQQARLSSGPLLDRDTAALFCCDSSTITLLLGDEGEPLALGRKSRAPSTAQRRALLARDGGCRFPGCTQHLWVDAHHVQPWEHGGFTDLDNLVLLCRFHHRAIHHRGCRIDKGAHQTFRFFAADGTPLLPSRTPARASGDLPTHGRSGRPVTPDTPVPNWDGHHPDYATAIEALMWLEENSHKHDTTMVA